MIAPSVSEILRISRPRFWIYEAATFAIIGTLSAAAGFSFLADWRYWVFVLYFLIPANLLIYGINDIFDYETDKLNPKKGDGAYESLVTPEKRKYVWMWILMSNAVFLPFVPVHTPSILAFTAFIFFATFYSALPIRAKSKPVLDSVFSAGHYVATGVFGYYVAGGSGFPLIGVIAGMLWCIAMHAYSAVPDIDADTRANLKTIAICIGRKSTIYLCWFLYVTAALLAYRYIPVSSVCGVIVYSLVMFRSLQTRTDEDLFKVYTYFPIINTLVGGIVSAELIIRNMF
ncbi:MAG TPA: prenyltransferase [Candidatus Nanoarchaeia archaeon]|nr:prenyltransferase [Candidatus Nanoarchaeia archaeon]